MLPATFLCQSRWQLRSESRRHSWKCEQHSHPKPDIGQHFRERWNLNQCSAATRRYGEWCHQVYEQWSGEPRIFLPLSGWAAQIDAVRFWSSLRLCLSDLGWSGPGYHIIVLATCCLRVERILFAIPRWIVSKHSSWLRISQVLCDGHQPSIFTIVSWFLCHASTVNTETFAHGLVSHSDQRWPQLWIDCWSVSFVDRGDFTELQTSTWSRRCRRRKNLPLLCQSEWELLL